MCEEQADDLGLLLACFGTSAATAAGRLNGKLQRRRSSSVQSMDVCAMLEEHAQGGGAPCSNGAMQGRNITAIGSVRIRAGRQQLATPLLQEVCDS